MTLLPWTGARSEDGWAIFAPSPHSQQAGPGKLITVRYYGVHVTMHIAGVEALRHCAEIAAQAGKPYFALYQSLPDALADRRNTLPLVTTLAQRPAAMAYILLQDAPEPGLLSTEKLISETAAELREAPQ